MARLLAAPKVMHRIRLDNKGATPFTTAPALIFRDDRILAQGMMTYTSAGAKTDLTLTAAVDMQVKKTDTETRREPKAAAWEGNEFARVDLDGTIALTNYTAKPLTLEVVRNVLGNVTTADNDGKIEMVNVLEDPSYAPAGGYNSYSYYPSWWGWYNWPYWWRRLQRRGPRDVASHAGARQEHGPEVHVELLLAIGPRRVAPDGAKDCSHGCGDAALSVPKPVEGGTRKPPFPPASSRPGWGEGGPGTAECTAMPPPHPGRERRRRYPGPRFFHGFRDAQGGVAPPVATVLRPIRGEGRQGVHSNQRSDSNSRAPPSRPGFCRACCRRAGSRGGRGKAGPARAGRPCHFPTTPMDPRPRSACARKCTNLPLFSPKLTEPLPTPSLAHFRQSRG